ncbi:MAG: ABC transporter ATP-binding protein [Planctomycetaceae bacterium]|nr:ABC transporter ATP-binding protein [Planctomycetaceae bacterium]
MIEFDSVTKMYGKVLGVNDICLSLPTGAYGLLGPNGAGKSTLLNLLTGQLVPSRGTVRVLGHKPRNNPDLMRRIGYCPGFEGMYSRTSGLEWVRFLLRMQGAGPKRAHQRAIECMEIVGMTHAMWRPISSYSRGMRQRTKLAQAIAHDPELLILDEPLSGLDPVGRSQMTNLLRDWIALGRSIIIASHVLHEIEALTESFLLISGGRLLASGTAEEVHQLLDNVPMELQIRSSQPRRLASLLLQHEVADTARVGITDSGDEVLIITTRQASQVSGYLPEWIDSENLQIYEMRTADDSMQSLFNSLMKIHRGEL